MAAALLLLLSPLLGVTALAIALFGGGGPVFFRQVRVGWHGTLFEVVKFRTMSGGAERRVTRLGAFLRRRKIDELPMLWNVVRGEMAWVGPRPDIPGYADRLEGSDRRLLELKPGLTCEATLKYRHEEELLARQCDPLRYNDTVIWPDKVRMNLEYYENRSAGRDVRVILKTVGAVFC